MTDDDELLSLAQTVGDDWREGPYYDEAELVMEDQWNSLIWPIDRRIGWRNFMSCELSEHYAAKEGPEAHQVRARRVGTRQLLRRSLAG